MPTATTSKPARPDWGRIAIVAGGGRLPVILSEALEREGRPPFIVALQGEADPSLHRFGHLEIATSEPGRLLGVLRREKIATAVLAGSVRSRPTLSRFRPDWTTLRLLGRIAIGLRQGDDSLLRQVVRMIEEAGIRVAGADDIVPSLLSPQGPIAGPQPDRACRADIEAARAAAIAIGALDIGQAAVAVGGRVVALEAAEGTDGMLERVAQLRASGRIRKTGGVLAKCVKPRQDRRIDLPSIGPGTVDRVAAAGLSGIVVDAGASLILDLAELSDRAEKAGVFVLGSSGLPGHADG